MKFINTTLNIALCLKKDMRFACQLEHHQRAAACEFLWGGGRGLSEIGQKTVTPHMLGYISEHTQQFWVTDRYLRCVCLCILCILTHLGSAGYRIMPSPSVSSGWDIIDQICIWSLKQICIFKTSVTSGLTVLCKEIPILYLYLQNPRSSL